MAVLVPGHTTIDKLIERARAKGMEYKTLPFSVVSEDGDMMPARYLRNPASGARFDLTPYVDGELVDPAIRAAIERRLGIDLSDG